ncbi:2-keto-4-pentenoate hydratase [Alteribacter keqinensis]|uniref:2-keto-4-pentenoate hydratase n=1 Tax=Alteribacter keqinensis TaxID=2483800 RepID=A0A3M7TNP2_9BACI|nr:2-keto-4-pentenoate hydratase [Alteribacter keqinensis]RNA67072.1 2-keto-4-pentenoate hydratase [Alteribacter keqinensis]
MSLKVKEYADCLLEAEKKRNGIQPLTEIHPELSIEEAYGVQMETIKRKVASGNRVVGRKIGLTSAAMQKLLGVDEPDYGHLLDTMKIENEGVVSFKHVMQPKAEAEVAFVLKEDLAKKVITVDDVLKATAYVVPAIEIVDSRIADWKIKLPDTIADNASSGLFVLGNTPFNTDDVNLEELTMRAYKNGEFVNEGSGKDVLGHPAACVAWLGEKLHELGSSLKAGDIILSGALSAAVDMEPGDTFHAEFDQLGTVKVTFGP